MTESDDHVIPYEEAVRRHRALEEAKKHRAAAHEVEISDAMVHLLHEEEAPDEEGPSPAALRRIVEREFADEEEGRSGRQPDERPEEPTRR